MLVALDALAPKSGEAAVYTDVRSQAGLSGDAMRAAVLDLQEEGLVEETSVEVAYGRGHKTTRPVKALCRRRPSGPSGQNAICPDGPEGSDHRDKTPL